MLRAALNPWISGFAVRGCLPVAYNFNTCMCKGYGQICILKVKVMFSRSLKRANLFKVVLHVNFMKICQGKEWNM